MVRIVTHRGEEPFFGEEPFLLFSQKHSFAATVFTALSGKVPDTQEEKLFNLLLNLSIDHGAHTPSAIATIARKREGASMGDAVGFGIQQINEQHGGAVEGAMRLFYEIANTTIETQDKVDTFFKNKKRIPGFGHRLYTKDPRAELLCDSIERLGFTRQYVVAARVMESALAQRIPEKNLPLNIDGAMAVALCTLGWKAEASVGVFIASRSTGLCAHYLSS